MLNHYTVSLKQVKKASSIRNVIVNLIIGGVSISHSITEYKNYEEQ